MNSISDERERNLHALIHERLPQMAAILISHFSCSPEDTQDALYKGLQKLLIRKPELLDDVDLKDARAYLYTIAKNTLIDRINEDQIVLHLDLNSIPIEISTCHPGESNSEDVICHKKIIALKLTRRQRQILHLRLVDRCSYQAIADKLCLNIGTVKATLNQIRQKLQSLIQTNTKPPG